MSENLAKINSSGYILLAKELSANGVLRIEEECEDYSPVSGDTYRLVLVLRYLAEGCDLVERRGALLIITEEIIGAYDPWTDLIKVRVQSPEDAGPGHRYYELTHDESGDRIYHEEEERTLVQLALMLECALSQQQAAMIKRNLLIGY